MSKITLLLENDRFDVDKKKLIKKSQYFESLFTHNFSDSKNDEHTVNYKVEPSILQDFCNWVEEDDLSPEENNKIKISLQKFLTDNYDCLKQFLELSILYSVEQLCLELSDILIQHWLKPEVLIDIWKLSKELSLTELNNIIYSVCLRRFMEVPEEELMSMSDDEFLKILCNVNIKSTNEYLIYLVNKKLENWDSNVQNDLVQKSLETLKELLSCNNLNRKPKVLNCFYTEIIKEENDNSCSNCRVVYAYQHKAGIFKELIEVWNVEKSAKEKDIAGMVVVGHDFSVYRIGGEIGIGSGQFDSDILRYCLISKKWYFIARLRKPRRHMAVALVNNKLILIGGVGRYRMKLQDVEVLNIHTGQWTDGPSFPETFTDTPPTCVINGIVTVWVSKIYMFNPSQNSWISVKYSIRESENRRVTCLVSYKNTLYEGTEEGRFVGYDVTWETVNDANGVEIITGALLQESREKIIKACKKINICENYGLVFYIMLKSKKKVMLGWSSLQPNGELIANIFLNYIFDEPVTSLVPLSCFNLIDPDTLHNQISLE